MAHPNKPSGTRQASPEVVESPARQASAGSVNSGATAPPTRAEFEQLAAQVRRLAAQVAHGRA